MGSEREKSQEKKIAYKIILEHILLGACFASIIDSLKLLYNPIILNLARSSHPIPNALQTSPHPKSATLSQVFFYTQLCLLAEDLVRRILQACLLTLKMDPCIQ